VLVKTMNRLPLARRAQILSMIAEGNSLRAVSRMADVSFNTVSKLLLDVADACERYQDATLHDLEVQTDPVRRDLPSSMPKPRTSPKRGERKAPDNQMDVVVALWRQGQLDSN
jgi:hypothetical protein